MIITFCGHSDFQANENYEKLIIDCIEKNAKDEKVEFYLGGYGRFDSFALECCKKYKQTHPDASLVFVSPYLNNTYLRKHLESYPNNTYDSILFPEIEKVPPKFAIVYRNRYMIEKADLIIAFVSHSYGGAFKTFQYAKRKSKHIFNLANKAL